MIILTVKIRNGHTGSYWTKFDEENNDIPCQGHGMQGEDKLYLILGQCCNYSKTYFHLNCQVRRRWEPVWRRRKQWWGGSWLSVPGPQRSVGGGGIDGGVHALVSDGGLQAVVNDGGLHALLLEVCGKTTLFASSTLQCIVLFRSSLQNKPTEGRHPADQFPL